MAKKSKLLSALDRYKGLDYELERQRKMQKQAEKRKRTKLVKRVNGAEESGREDGDVERTIDNGESYGEDGAHHAEVDSDNEGWETEEEDEEEDEENEDEVMYDISQLNDSLSSSGDENETELIKQNRHNNHQNLSQKSLSKPPILHDVVMANGGGNDNDSENEGIPLSDLDSLASEEKGDIIPRQRLTINHTEALNSALESIALPLSSLPFAEHQSITSTTPTTIPDIENDLDRELAFYSQSLAAAQEARKKLHAEGVPFSRPTDYFAEMVKSDEHMGRVKQKLVDAAASKKAAAEARKQRDLRKFGKQVQTAKLQERAKEKREMLDKINLLKRKRKGLGPATEAEDDPFDIAIDDAARDTKSLRDRRDRRRGDHSSGPSQKRQRKDQKYGFGGKKRHAKSGDAISSADMRSFPGRRMKHESGGSGRNSSRGGDDARGRKRGGGRGGSARPGKSKRVKARL